MKLTKGKFIGILLVSILLLSGTSQSTAYFQIEGEWIEVQPAIKPDKRQMSDMVFMTNHSAFFMFGGLYNYLETGFYNDTWVFNTTLNSWVDMDPLVAPSHRAQHTMTYDPVHDKVVLFSGQYRENLYNDTWIYDFNQNTWTNVTPSISPEGRISHSMVYDYYSGNILMYGGRGEGNKHLDDTWYFNVESLSWNQLNPTLEPTANTDTDLSYDLENDVVILFGGANTYPDQGGYTSEVKKETWFFDPKTKEWNRMFAENEDRLLLQYQHRSVYIPNVGTMVFGGYEPGTPGRTPGPINHTLILDYPTKTWTKINYTLDTSIDGYDHFAMAYNNISDYVMMFGGYGNSVSDANYIFNITLFKEVIVETPEEDSAIPSSSDTSSTPPDSTEISPEITPTLELASYPGIITILSLGIMIQLVRRRS